MPKSSINIAKVSVHSFTHNDRTETKTAKSVFSEFTENNICDVSASVAKQKFDMLYDSSKKERSENRLRTADKKNTLWEAVVNIKPDTTLDDLKKVSNYVEKEFGFTILQTAIHRDEGHYNEDNKFEINEHAHLSFFTLDKNGNQMMRAEHVSKQKLRELQTVVAELLQMERGEDARDSKRKRLGHKEYKTYIQELTKQNDEIQSVYNAFTKSLDSDKIKIKDLTNLNKQLQATISSLEIENSEKKILHEQRKEMIVKYKEQIRLKDFKIEELSKDINAIAIKLKSPSNSIKAITSEIDFLQNKIEDDKNFKATNVEKLQWYENYIKELEEEIRNLKNENISSNYKYSDGTKLTNSEAVEYLEKELKKEIEKNIILDDNLSNLRKEYNELYDDYVMLSDGLEEPLNDLDEENLDDDDLSNPRGFKQR